ncbi:MAG TPA: sigma-70 family RNA polymerase sigma factor [Kofleriaceae bacterium]|jgi:RNA polymerase sigma-70 factor (ECF subfamily)|nr:sigma-70 family RNA polymerase sigma factor [Kofleriaceae bacterium]
MLAAREKRTEFERQAMVHTDALFGAAYRLTRNARDAEDLVQDSLLRAYRFWDSFEQDSNCKAWLLRIVTNTFINEYQRKKRSREVLDAASAEQDATDGVLVHAEASDRQSPERTMVERSVSDDVQRALEALPEDFRTAVVLCDVQGLSYKEIADIMETPVGTVMSRLFRGRKLLASTLREFAVSEGYVKSGAGPGAGADHKAGKPSGKDDAKPPDAGAKPAASDETIDFEKYRAARTAREGSQS